ncbi:hypothetical protein L208DRAFT_1448990 [Tricholoma matsutake]|nr:hypothetical protein L208DRAFT_1448990 [Tricholoma matsutake 945]
MPVRHIKEHATRRMNTDSSKPRARRFTNIDEIRSGLRSQNQDEFIQTLTSLRNQLSIKSVEDAPSPQDERLLLAQHWMENVPGAHDIFGIWEEANPRQTSLLALVVAVLSSLLALLSSHYAYHGLGQPIIKTLLTPPYVRRLNSYLGGSHSELILVTLKLFNGMSSFGGGREKTAVMDSFAWGIKSLPKILNMRRKSKTEDSPDPLAKPDIRTLYLFFILSFVGQDSPAAVKTTFIEQHRETFLSMFKGLIQDSYSVIQRVLEVCWSGIWSDLKIKRTLKIALFNETTISHILKLYDRSASEDDNSERIPADLVHHFLLAICTRPGMGICFKDRGWYPREFDGGDDQAANDDDGDEPTYQKGGKIYNKILANILKTLKVNEDSRQQELALKIMSACPELVAGYWSGAALTLEPRLSTKWLANISFFGSVISLSVPSPTFHLPNSMLYQPAPPPLSAIIENIFPSVNTKSHFSKGLQSSSGLVQHCTAIAMAKCLAKYEAVVRFFRQIEDILGEDETDGQWGRRQRDVEREARRRLPDFQVVVAFSQQKLGVGQTAPPNPTKAALLSEAAQRLLWMYHRCLPSVVAEARFDVGKLLQNFSPEIVVDGQQESLGVAAKLHMVRQLHVLRLLKDSDQFNWSGKMGSSSRSYLSVLLEAYTRSDVPAIRTALCELLQHVLAESIMFQEEPDEPHLWLLSLPTSRRAADTESRDGASLTDEADSVITFLDECIQRCLKTPYRYLEELYAISKTTDSDNQGIDACPSPLLLTVLEQLSVKVEKKSLSPSDVLALTTFMRKLVLRLMTKLQSLKILLAVAAKVDDMLSVDRLFTDYPIVTSAIRREVALLWACLQPSLDPPVPSGPAVREVQDFLAQVEQLPAPSSTRARIIAAYELIDWLRLIEQPYGTTEVRRLSAILVKFHIPSLLEIGEHLDPMQVSFWDAVDLVLPYPELRMHLQFDVLFRHSSEQQLTNTTCRTILADAASKGAPAVVDIKRVVCLIEHRLSHSEGRSHIGYGLIMLLTSILERLSLTMSSVDILSLKEFVFVRPGIIKTSLMSETLSDLVRDGYHQLVKIVLDPRSQGDRMLISDISNHWLERVKNSLRSDNLVSSASLWIKYFQSSDLFGLLDTLGSGIEMMDSSTSGLLDAILLALRSTLTSDTESEDALLGRLPQLLALRPFLGDSDTLEEMIAAAVEASLPAYSNGQLALKESFDEPDIIPFIKRSEVRWSRRLEPLSTDLPIDSFLMQEHWSISTSKIISGLIYRRSLSPAVFFSWLSTDHCNARELQHFAPVLQAFLDTCSSGTNKIPAPESNVWYRHLARLAQAALDASLPQELRGTCGACVSLLLRLFPARIAEFVAVTLDQLRSLPVTSLTAEVLAIGRRLHMTNISRGKALLTTLAEHGVQWALRRFPEDLDGSSDVIIEELASVVRIASDIKPHLVETLVGVVTRNQLSNVAALELAAALLKVVPLKPAVVNRHLQSIVQHPKFFKFSATHASGSRDSIVQLLHVLFNLHPANTCQVTHVEPLVRIYRGTLSPADGQLLSVFRLFETQRGSSVASLLARWSPSANQASSTSLEAIQSLDPTLVLRTCLNFPRWRRLEEPMTGMGSARDAQLYDPVFLILLFAQTLAEGPPSSAFAWVELFRTNIVSLLIKATSSKCGRIREVALCQIAALWQHLELADLQEKLHILHILTLLKDVLPSASDPEKQPPRLPSYTTLLLSHALRGVFYPSNFIYPMTARFLLQRPGLDTSDVPMLYNMLYSSSDDWKKERGWIIRFLSDGMMSSEDWRVLKRRHTWDLLASLFQSSEGDRTLRRGIFEVLANLTCNTQATTSLVLKSGLFSWIEIQLITTCQVTDGVTWVKILDNIMSVVDPHKIEVSTNGEWRSVICRCLSMVLNDDKTSNTAGILPCAASAILRLSMLPGQTVLGLASLLNGAVNCLKRMETTVLIPSSSKRLSSAMLKPCRPLFRASEIHEPYPEREPWQTWGQCVETLWHATMTMGSKPPVWDVLCSRLSLWRAVTGSEASPIGEWARMQVICNLSNE